MQATREKNELKNVDLNNLKVTRSKMHPKSEMVFNLTQQKVIQELGTDFKMSRDLAEFNLYAFPLIKSFDVVSCHLIFNLFAFILDDHLEKFPNDYENCIKLRIEHFPKNEQLSKIWQHFLNVGEKVMGKLALDQLIEITTFVLTKIPELDRILNGRTMPTDEDLVNLRLIDCGAPHQLYFILVDAQIELTDALKNDPNYIGLNKQASIHWALINDLYSLRKEINENVYKFNYVYVKMKNGNLTAQASVNEIILEVLESERMAHIYGEKLKARNDLNLYRYVEGVYASMTGNHYWSTLCKRYNKLY